MNKYDSGKLTLTGKMGCDEEEGSSKKGKADAHSSFGFDLWDDPGCDCGVLHLCEEHNLRWASQSYWFMIWIKIVDRSSTYLTENHDLTCTKSDFPNILIWFNHTLAEKILIYQSIDGECICNIYDNNLKKLEKKGSIPTLIMFRKTDLSRTRWGLFWQTQLDTKHHVMLHKA